MAAIKFWRASGLTGGATSDLDAISVNSIAHGHTAICSYAGGLFIYEYDATSTATESSPNVIIPDSNLSGVGAWELLSINQASDTLGSGVILTGGVYGLDYSRTGDNEVTITAGNCRDSTNSVWMSAASSQTVDTSGITTASVAISLFLCSDGVVRCDDDETGATLLSAYTKRWIGFVKNNSSGLLSAFYQRGNLMSFSDPTEATIATISDTSYTALTGIDVLLPETRIIGIEYGAGLVSSDDNIFASEDGTHLAFAVGRSSTASGGAGIDAWGDNSYQKSSLKPYNPDRYFKRGSNSVELLVHSVLMRR